VRLPAYLDERFTPPAPSIYSQIESKAIAGRQNLSFLIDTAKHDQDRLDKHGKQLVMQLPCLLGRDILQRYRFVYDKPRQQVYLEK
jgi:hypothetical protein